MAGIRRFITVCALLSVASRATAAFNTTSISGTGAYDSDALLCNNTFARANATGIFRFDPGVPQGRTSANDTGYAPEAAWAVAVSENPNNQSNNFGLQYSILYSTGGANYSDDVHLGYDVCAILIDPSNFYNNTNIRGQSDNGSCLQTFDSNCVNAINAAAYKYTGWIDTASPRPNSNLTSTSLPTVCDKISTLLGQNLPTECQPFFNGTEWIDSGSALTEYNRNGLSSLDNTCLVNGTGASAFHNVYTAEFATAEDTSYDVLTGLVIPVINIFLPTANAEVSSSNVDTNTVMTCMHINHYNSGSRVSPSLGTSTPVDYGTSSKALSGGAIAGIVVGSVVGAALIVLAIVFCVIIRRRRRRRATGEAAGSAKAVEDANSHEEVYPPEKTEAHGVEAGGADINELSPQSFKSAELPHVQQRAELVGSGHHAAELQGSRELAEMPGDHAFEKAA